MRIVYVIPAEAFGGAERQAVLHIARLPRWGIDVIPLVGPGRIILDSLREQGIDSARFTPLLMSQYARPFTRASFAGYLVSTIAAMACIQFEIGRLLHKSGADLVLASRPTSWGAVAVPSRVLGVPQIWRAGGRVGHSAQVHALKLLVPRAPPAALVCNCEAVRQSLQPYIPAPSWVIPNGIDAVRFDPDRTTPMALRDRFGIAPGALLVGVVARPAPGKGLELLAEALQRLSGLPAPVHVVIAGDHGWRPHFEGIVERLGLAGRISFAGHVRRIERFLRACDMVVLPSAADSSEGLPNALLEAMAMQLPVVATRVGGIPELVEDQETGLLIRPGDADALAAALQRLAGDAGLRQQLGARGRRRVLERFSDTAVVERLAELIHSVAAAHGRG